MIFLGLLLVLLPAIKAMVVQKPEEMFDFQFGIMYLSSSPINYEKILIEMQSCIKDQNLMYKVLNVYLSSFNKTLEQRTQESNETTIQQYEIDLSNQLNFCSTDSKYQREIFFQASLVMWPGNYITAKNYAFMMEIEGYYSQAHSIYQTCYSLSKDPGCHLHMVSSCPIVSYSIAQTQFIYIHMLQEYFKLLRFAQPRSDEDFAPLNQGYNILRELPINLQYLGYNTGMLYELFQRSLLAYYPQLERVLIPQARSEVRLSKLRIGIVAEYLGNSSPGICMQDIFKQLFLIYRDKYDLIFFEHEDLITFFADEMRSIAREIYTLNTLNVSYSQELISQANIDVLIYIALPTNKFTYFLSFARLAPIQIQLGLGHPVSSGIRAIDYSVIPEAMLPDFNNNNLVRKSVNSLQCAFEAFVCELSPEERNQMLFQTDIDLLYSSSTNLSNYYYKDFFTSCEISSECFQPPGVSLYYSEQVVRFQSLGHYIPEAKKYYPENSIEYKTIETYSKYRSTPNTPISDREKSLEKWITCQELEILFLDIFNQNISQILITPRNLGCFDPISQVFYPKKQHMYHMLQYLKKFHPSIDQVILQILLLDNEAIFIVPKNFQILIPRLYSQLRQYVSLYYSSDSIWNSVTLEAFSSRHFLCLSRISHLNYLQLMGLSSIFINHLPFGSGMTSAEAISMCVPVVIWRKQLSVLQFAHSQLTQLPSHLHQHLILNDASLFDFVNRIVNIAKGNYQSKSLNEWKDWICREKDALFDEERIKESIEEWDGFLSGLSNNI